MNEWVIVKAARSDGKREYLAANTRMSRESATIVAKHMNEVIPSPTHFYRAERA